MYTGFYASRMRGHANAYHRHIQGILHTHFLLVYAYTHSHACIYYAVSLNVTTGMLYVLARTICYLAKCVRVDNVYPNACAYCMRPHTITVLFI